MQRREDLMIVGAIYVLNYMAKCVLRKHNERVLDLA